MARRGIPARLRKPEQFEQARQVLECAEKAVIDARSRGKGPDVRVIKIESRSGKIRRLVEPIEEIKLIQNLIGLIVHNILKNTGSLTGVKRQNQKAVLSLHGFMKERSIKSYAGNHTRRNVVVKMDIKNYFESITEPLIFRAMDKGELIGYHFPDWLRNYISTYCLCSTNPMRIADKAETARKALALGFPSSPSLANVVSAFLVVPPILGVLKEMDKYDIAFTMYADDMTFSSHYPECAKIARIVPMLLKREGLSINSKKTKILKQSARQVVCGVVVNSRMGATRAYRRALRKQIHHTTKELLIGAKTPANINVSVLRGQVSHVEFLNSAHAESLKRQLKTLEELV